MAQKPTILHAQYFFCISTNNMNPPKVGASDRKIAGTSDSKHSTSKCLVTPCTGKINQNQQRMQMTTRFLTKINTYISGSKHGRFILNHKLLSENDSSRSWIDLIPWHGSFSSKKSNRLTKFLHAHIAKCNIVIDTYNLFIK